MIRIVTFTVITAVMFHRPSFDIGVVSDGCGFISRTCGNDRIAFRHSTCGWEKSTKAWPRNSLRPPHMRMGAKRSPIRMATMMLLIVTMINLLQSEVPCPVTYLSYTPHMRAKLKPSPRKSPPHRTSDRRCNTKNGSQKPQRGRSKSFVSNKRARVIRINPRPGVSPSVIHLKNRVVSCRNYPIAL